jgi:hypothetical protein
MLPIYSVDSEYFTTMGYIKWAWVIWYIFPRLGKLYQEKSGNPGLRRQASNPILTLFYFREIWGNETL